MLRRDDIYNGAHIDKAPDLVILNYFINDAEPTPQKRFALGQRGQDFDVRFAATVEFTEKRIDGIAPVPCCANVPESADGDADPHCGSADRTTAATGQPGHAAAAGCDAKAEGAQEEGVGGLPIRVRADPGGPTKR